MRWTSVCSVSVIGGGKVTRRLRSAAGRCGRARRRSPRPSRSTGGSSRTVPGPVALRISRSSLSARRTRPGASSASNATISPRPRTSAVPGSAARPVRRRSPSSRTDASSASSERTSNAARAALATSGPPANVEPWSPGWKTSASRSPVTNAPIGSPPPSAFAVVSASGTTPVCSYAHSVPVRPMPVWISSNTSAAPTRSHAARAVCSSSSGRTCTPVSPWIGSSSTAAVPPCTAASSAAGSGATTTNPGTSGANGACLDSCGVALSAP